MLIFIISGLLIIILQAEFLGILYILVYAGAITVLFLFVIMMCNLREFNPNNPKLWKNQFLSQKSTRILFGIVIGLLTYFYASFLIEQYFLNIHQNYYFLENNDHLFNIKNKNNLYYLNKANTFFDTSNLEINKLLFTCNYFNIHPMHIFFNFEFLQNNINFAQNLYKDNFGFIFILCTLCLLVAMLGPTILTRANRLNMAG